MAAVITSCGMGVGECKINRNVGVMVGVSKGAWVGKGVAEGVKVGVNNFAVCVAAAAAVWAMMTFSAFGSEVGGCEAGMRVETSQLITKIVKIKRKYNIRFCRLIRNSPLSSNTCSKPAKVSCPVG